MVKLTEREMMIGEKLDPNFSSLSGSEQWKLLTDHRLTLAWAEAEPHNPDHNGAVKIDKEADALLGARTMAGRNR